MDLSNVLVTDEMAADYAVYKSLKTVEERAAFNAQRNERYDSKTPEEKELHKRMVMKSMRNIKAELDEISLKVELNDVSKMLSMSYIAEKYFGKTSQWLYQRINGNTVNGKPASFTPDERKKLANSLCDIGGLIRRVGMQIA